MANTNSSHLIFAETDKSIKVGLIGPLPPPYGGMANQLNQLKNLLETEGVNVFVVQTNAPVSNHLVSRIKGIRAFVRLVPYLFKVWALTEKVDVIHLFSNSGWAWHPCSAPVLLIAHLKNIPVIVNYRGGEANKYFGNSIKFVRPSMNLASKIVVPSGFLKKVFEEYDFESLIIPNIIDLDRFTPISHEQNFHLIVTRNLETIYGIETAIKAVFFVKKDFPKVHLSIAGSGEQKAALQSMVSDLGLENNVNFVGRLQPDDVAKLYQTADIMLNPSLVDNMPNSVLEALASGVPVITTDVGGVPYIVEDRKTALLVKVNDPEMMAEKINELFLDQYLYTQLVKNGITEVEQYAWKNVKKHWLSLYKSLSRSA